MDTRTSYLGMRLEHPFIAGASPLGYHLDSVKRLEDAGCAAVVLHSLFEEQISRADSWRVADINVYEKDFADILQAFPQPEEYPQSPDAYAEHVYRVKRAVGIPVIGSLNGRTGESWLRFARVIEQAGADALELNLYHLAADSRRTASEVETADLELIAAVRACVTIPLAIKLSPYYSAFANFAVAVTEAGADGLVLFNRFYQPDLDLDTLEVVPRLGLSQPWEMRLPVRWIAILRPQLGLGISLAATSGAHSATDVVKGLMVGADVVMMTSALLRHGPEHIRTVETELRAWMTEREYDSVEQLRGSASQANVDDPSAFERANYMQTLRSWVTPER